MMISNFYLLLNYFLSLILFFNFSNPMFFWVLMEYNLISFVLLLYFRKEESVKQDSINYVIFYFLIQSSASIVFLSNFSLGEWFSIFNYDLMFIISLIFKIGLFPLFFWLFSLVGVLHLTPLIFLLSIQKIPLFCGLFFSSSFIMLIILILSFMFGSVMLLFSNNLLFMFVSSSISNSLMMFFLFSFNFLSFLTFFIMYSIFLYFSLLCLKRSSDLSSPLLIFSYVFFLGMPPLGLFFYKLLFFSLSFDFLGPFELIFLWSFSFLSLMGYLKFFFHSFFSLNLLYQSFSPSDLNKKTFLFFIVLSFLLFTF